MALVIKEINVRTTVENTREPGHDISPQLKEQIRREIEELMENYRRKLEEQNHSSSER